MVGVFSIFATLSLLEFKQLGVGLAAAVLIDATMVRAVLLPAAMALLAPQLVAPAGSTAASPPPTELRGMVSCAGGSGGEFWGSGRSNAR